MHFSFSNLTHLVLPYCVRKPIVYNHFEHLENDLFRVSVIFNRL